MAVVDVVAVAGAVVDPAADAVDADPVADAVALTAVATVVVVDGAFFSSFLLAIGFFWQKAKYK